MTESEKYTISRPVVLVLFFFSGASALIYEVIWGRMLTLVFGGTSFAIATVLAAFMGGLALGSYLFGKLIDKRGHPLVVYGLLEGGIGVWALLVPYFLELLDSGYAHLYRELDPSFYTLSLIRFAMTFAVLIVPTTFMGGTLPVLMRLLTATGALVGRTSALLYFANTAGAVAGTFTTGFALIPRFGISGTTHMAVAVNLGVTALALYTARRVRFEPAAAAEAPSPAAARPAAEGEGRARSLVLVVYALSGLTALAYEVAWTRVLVSIIGTTTYAFTTMLTTFLLGLALGSLIFARIADRIGTVRPLALMQLAIGLLSMAAIPVLGALPALFIELQGAMGGGWWGSVGMRFLLCVLAMLPPTILMGGTFPVVARLYAGDARGIGAKIGKMYAFNTVGAILGSFLGGFLAIPLLGQENTILAAVALNVLAALALVTLVRGPAAARVAVAAACIASLALAAALPGMNLWDKKMMSSGVYLYGSEYKSASELKKGMEKARLLFFREDKDATVSVWQEGSVKYMRINGKTEASTGSDMLTQRMVGTLPLLFHSEPRTALLIGLASGVTAGSMLRHPIERLECVEIVRGMDRAAALFSRENYDCLDDPRFELIESDGRNHLLLTDSKYDVIVSQGSNPWVSGCVNLFTAEYFELARERLNPGGVVGQWVQIYAMSREDFMLVLSTFHEVFPCVSVWQASEGDIVLLGSETDFPRDYASIRSAMTRPGVEEDLASVGLETFAGLFSCFLLDTRGLEEYLDGFEGRVTDDNPSLEFTMPRLIGTMTHHLRIAELAQHRVPAWEFITGRVPDDVAAELRSAYEARGKVFEAVARAADGRPLEALDLYRAALAENPEDALGLENLSRLLLEYATLLVRRGRFDEAAAAFDEVRRLGHPLHSPKAASNLGMCYRNRGRIEEAVKLWRSVADVVSEANYNLAGYYSSAGFPDSAEAAYEKAIELDPNDSDSMNALAWMLAGESRENAGRDLDKALGLASRATALDPSGPNLDTLGWVYYKRGEFDRAVEVLERCVEDWGEDPVYLYHLGLAYGAQGRAREARRTLRRCAALSGGGELQSMAMEALSEY